MSGRRHVGLHVFILVLLATAVGRAWAGDFHWDSPSDGNWSDLERWSPTGAPGSSPEDTATIGATASGSYMVQLDTNPTLRGFTLNSPNASFLASGRTFTVNGPANLLSGSVSFTDSNWSGAGTLTNAATATFFGRGAINSPLIQNGKLDIDGLSLTPTYGMAGLLTIADGFTNAGAITLDSFGSGGPIDSELWINGSGQLVNVPTGVLTVNPGAGGARTISANLTNDGTVNINASTQFFGTTHTNNGTFNVASGASLDISYGTFNQNGGPLKVDGTMACGRFNFNGGTIQGTVTVGGTLAIAPGVTSAASFLVNGHGGLVGDVHYGQNITMRSDGSLAPKLTSSSGFTNAGTITLDGGGCTLKASGTGLVNAPTGVLNFNSDLPLSIADGAIDNRGTMNIAKNAGFWSSVGNTGRIELLSPGVVYVEDGYTQGSTGQLGVTLGLVDPGYEDSYLSVSAAATLDGTLDLSLVNGYCPVPGDQFAVLTCGSRSGEFSAISGLTNIGGHAGLWLEPQYTSTGLTLLAKGLPADADLNGKVDFVDYLAMEASFGKTGATWAQGDFDHDGAVTFADYLILEGAFGKSVPEPAALSLVALAGLGLLKRRNR